MNLFGSGFLYGIPTADALGAAISNPTPVLFGTLQEVSLDISFENKLLHGQNQFAVAVGRGKGKIGAKAKFANISAAAFSSLFFGGTTTNNITAGYNDATGTIVPTTPFTITVVPPSSGVFSRDLGVRNGVTGLALTRVASAPSAGQYTVSAVGVYVFAAADVGINMFISYEYTATAASAKQYSMINQPMGYAPTFMAILSAPYAGKNAHFKFPACISSKLGMAFKNDDFVIPEMDFDCFADAGGNIFSYAFSE